MTAIHMDTVRRRDTAGRIAITALCGVVTGIAIAFAVVGVRDTVRDLTAEPVTCISQTWA